MKNCFLARASAFTAAILLVAACQRREPAGWQGYLEGEFVHVASPLGGRLERLEVAKGTQVLAGAPLFILEHASERAQQREAADRLRATQARWEDMKKGVRPSELSALEARIEQARSAAELSQRELERLSGLFKNGAIAANEYDRARLTHERNGRAIDELTAQLTTARLGGRSDAIMAAEAEVAASAASKERADWSVTQKTQTAPRAAFVYDTLYREGEFVPAGLPIVSLLPPENLKVRFFVPEAEFAALKAGDRVRITLSGQPALEGQINYLSPRPEYTPPILYNRDNRAKLVFMVEAALDPAVARQLHPGQPVDVSLKR